MMTIVDIIKFWGTGALIGFPIGFMVSRAIGKINSTGIHVGSGGQVTFSPKDNGLTPKGGNPEIKIDHQ